MSFAGSIDGLVRHRSDTAKPQLNVKISSSETDQRDVASSVPTCSDHIDRPANRIFLPYFGGHNRSEK